MDQLKKIWLFKVHYFFFFYFIPSPLVWHISIFGLIAMRISKAVSILFQMYQGGKLLFCDYIFNGYSTSEDDLMRQIAFIRKMAKSGYFLPADFRFR